MSAERISIGVEYDVCRRCGVLIVRVPGHRPARGGFRRLTKKLIG